jgi:hypothetical protein
MSVRNLAACGGITTSFVLQAEQASVRESEVINSRGKATDWLHFGQGDVLTLTILYSLLLWIFKVK